MGKSYWSCCPNGTSLSPLATTKLSSSTFRPRCLQARIKSSSNLHFAFGVKRRHLPAVAAGPFRPQEETRP